MYFPMLDIRRFPSSAHHIPIIPMGLGDGIVLSTVLKIRERNSVLVWPVYHDCPDKNVTMRVYTVYWKTNVIRKARLV